jgi:hypothetical protein
MLVIILTLLVFSYRREVASYEMDGATEVSGCLICDRVPYVLDIFLVEADEAAAAQTPLSFVPGLVWMECVTLPRRNGCLSLG